MRLINANRLKALLMVDFMQLELFGQKYKVSDALRTVDNTPTEDAVPVIRCKDCKWWRDSDHTCRCFLTSPRTSDDYCSRAERKEE